MKITEKVKIVYCIVTGTMHTSTTFLSLFRFVLANTPYYLSYMVCEGRIREYMWSVKNLYLARHI